MPLILGAGTGGNRIIINLQEQSRHNENKFWQVYALLVCEFSQFVPVLLRHSNQQDKYENTHSPNNKSRGEWKGRL